MPQTVPAFATPHVPSVVAEPVAAAPLAVLACGAITGSLLLSPGLLADVGVDVAVVAAGAELSVPGDEVAKLEMQPLWQPLKTKQCAGVLPQYPYWLQQPPYGPVVSHVAPPN